jgi:hypothetical protein
MVGSVIRKEPVSICGRPGILGMGLRLMRCDLAGVEDGRFIKRKRPGQCLYWPGRVNYFRLMALVADAGG